MGKLTWAQTERRELCDLFERVGPDAPTLCGDWTTRDLAAHLIAREGRPDASIGIMFKPMAGWLGHVQRQIAQRPWPELIAKVRNGPPPLTAFALPGVDSLFNTTEFYVHHEDVLRAQPDWRPRKLHPKLSDALWKVVKTRARGFYRNARVTVILVRTDGTHGEVKASSGTQRVVIAGPAQELLLYSFGRKDHARVRLEGPDSAIASIKRANLAI